MSRTIINK